MAQVSQKTRNARQVSNPVILVDEVDKLGRDFRAFLAGALRGGFSDLKLVISP
jgi:ATP-dependent Lon protease